MTDKLKSGLEFSYFDNVEDYWHKNKTLDIYLTDTTEGRQLNLDARGKDYATNILSYPSELPSDVLALMDDIPLGELIICHEVLVREADEQDKRFEDHLHHLLVHGILHLLGFDHEISDADADEMEGFEIEILQGLGISNPYL
nr:rRNA maturation RNase YbeY [Moraxella bovoculi]